MKRFVLIIVVFLNFSCEDVVEVDLDETQGRLVVEASILWKKGTAGNMQEIILSTTTPFYKDEIPFVNDAEVTIINTDGTEFKFNFEGNGRYISENFIPELNETYFLEIYYNAEIYKAAEVFKSVSEIDKIEQAEGGGFAGDEYELKFYYTDPVDTEDYYLFKFSFEDRLTFEIYEDEFTNGNQIFGYYSNEDLEKGSLVTASIQGISKNYYEYLFILRSQVGSNQGGPFETMPATVKGNIINETNPENYPLGYFRLSETERSSYTIE
ncbi:DUF4249 family protein [Gramella sp. AN32]|uniref:DUF4249 family protein n=1 Tax=Christiangramia antarctica TaxID=2058158 RepID=A0ABW5X6A8_9FLAO|nr:DUF4249 family protein [Gramella sp. AN32]MCM4157919.1 DUF4249 domain-containing protein [Gramella sp. AN32]